MIKEFEDQLKYLKWKKADGILMIHAGIDRDPDIIDSLGEQDNTIYQRTRLQLRVFLKKQQFSDFPVRAWMFRSILDKEELDSVLNKIKKSRFSLPVDVISIYIAKQDFNERTTIFRTKLKNKLIVKGKK